MDFKKLPRIFLMANLPPKRTGLPYQVWYSAKEPRLKPRIKVDLPDGRKLSIEIETHKVTGPLKKISSNDLNKILEWMDLNKEILLKYWNEARSGLIDNADVIRALKKF